MVERQFVPVHGLSEYRHGNPGSGQDIKQIAFTLVRFPRPHSGRGLG
jgi:hypothetical protein